MKIVSLQTLCALELIRNNIRSNILRVCGISPEKIAIFEKIMNETNYCDWETHTSYVVTIERIVKKRVIKNNEILSIKNTKRQYEGPVLGYHQFPEEHGALKKLKMTFADNSRKEINFKI